MLPFALKFKNLNEVLNLLKVSTLLMSEDNEFQSLMPLKKKVVEACPETCGTTNSRNFLECYTYENLIPCENVPIGRMDKCH